MERRVERQGSWWYVLVMFIFVGLPFSSSFLLISCYARGYIELRWAIMIGCVLCSIIIFSLIAYAIKEGVLIEKFDESRSVYWEREKKNTLVAGVFFSSASFSLFSRLLFDWVNGKFGGLNVLDFCMVLFLGIIGVLCVGCYLNKCSKH